MNNVDIETTVCEAKCVENKEQISSSRVCHDSHEDSYYNRVRMYKVVYQVSHTIVVMTFSVFLYYS